MSRLPADARVSLLIAALCGIALWDLSNTPSSGAFIKSTGFPVVVVTSLLVLSILLMMGSMIRAHLDRKPADTVPAPAAPVSSKRHGLRVVGLTALTIAFIAGLPWLGYVAASIVYFVLASILYGSRRAIPVLLVATLLPFLLMLFFERYMVVLLPSSPWFG